MKPATQKTISASLLLFILYFVLSTEVSFAQTPVSTGLSAIPPRLEVSVKADATNTQVIKVRNESTDTKTIDISIKDFIVTDNKGTPNFLESSDTESGE